MSPYGFCPMCGAAGVSRERRPNGNDRCEVGHTYRSADARKTPLKQKRSKYGNKPQVVDGIRFASKKEAARDAQLVTLEKQGKINMLHRQRAFDLFVEGKKICRYVADWAYVENHKAVVEDAKGHQTRDFKLKWKLCQALYPQIEWRLS